MVCIYIYIYINVENITYLHVIVVIDFFTIFTIECGTRFVNKIFILSYRG
jgi:hypothetical protein